MPQRPHTQKLDSELSFPENPARELIQLLDEIPASQDPIFEPRFTQYALSLNCDFGSPIPHTAPNPSEPFVVLPSDSIALIQLKEACREYAASVFTTYDALGRIQELLYTGRHPIQSTSEQLKDIKEQHQQDEIGEKIADRLISLEKGEELFKVALAKKLQLLEIQLTAYGDAPLFYELAEKQLEQELDLRDEELRKQVAIGEKLKLGEVPDSITNGEVAKRVPIINQPFFQLYLATRHSASFVSGAVSLSEAPLDEYKNEYAPSYREGYRRRDMVSLTGSSLVGEVDFIRQVHDIPGQNESDRLLVSYSQEFVLRHLVTIGPKFVFDEGTASGILPSSSYREEALGIKEALAAFPGGLPEGDLTYFQRSTLIKLGAARLYAALHPDVSVMPTTSEESHTLQRLIQGRDPSLRAVCVITLREQEALKHIRDFLDKHPGEKVALVYGAAHHFTATSLGISEAELSAMPLIRATDWPALRFELSSSFSESISQAILQARNEEVKALIALNAGEISVEAFSSIGSPGLKLSLLSKVLPDYTRHTSADDFAGDLLESLPDTDEYQTLCDAINNALTEDGGRRAPFRSFSLKKYDWDSISTADYHTVDQALLQEDHYPTIYELARKARILGVDSFGVVAAPELQRKVLEKVYLSDTLPESVFEQLASCAHSPSVVETLMQHEADLTGPFFGCRFASSPLHARRAVPHAYRTDHWASLDWEARAEVIKVISYVDEDGSEFFTDLIGRALSGDTEARDIALCVLETVQHMDYGTENFIIKASPLLSLPEDPTVTSAFESLLAHEVEKSRPLNG